MGTGLYKLAQEDPSFHFQRDDETNQTVIEVRLRVCSGSLSGNTDALRCSHAVSLGTDQTDRSAMRLLTATFSAVGATSRLKQDTVCSAEEPPYAQP
jgi:hypothetical protein